ncbi:MAG: DUF2924 domain-containing protein [Alphaproteobacteria bacterium]|nr:MAG: DUF2924 domain-containing protein [Alphaproteobacteria bacterium]
MRVDGSPSAIGTADRDDVNQDITSLRSATTKELHKKWQRLFNRPVPQGFSRDLVIRRLAHTLQEQAFGGLAPVHRRKLATLSRQLVENNLAGLDTGNDPRPGSRLIREWQGRTYVVNVLEDGFEHEGERYGSLSKLAREITGTRWSGPRFFGLKKPETGHV